MIQKSTYEAPVVEVVDVKLDSNLLKASNEKSHEIPGGWD